MFYNFLQKKSVFPHATCNSFILQNLPSACNVQWSDFTNVGLVEKLDILT